MISKYQNNSNKKIKSQARGFSLVELIVVIAIFLILTSVVLFNQNKFSSDISLTNITYDIALKIRESQVYGTLVQQRGAGEFAKAYGVQFYLSETTARFRQFIDLNNDKKYTVGGTNEELKDYGLVEGNTIQQVCTYNSVGGTTPAGCLFSVSNVPTVSDINISFLRPNPEALIVDSQSSALRSRVEISVASSLGDKKKLITVFNTGQISVKSL